MTRRRAEGRAVSRPRPRHGQVCAQHTPTIRQHVRCDTVMEACDRHGTARRGVGQGAQGCGARRTLHGSQGRARVRCDTAGQLDHDTAPRRACAHLGMLVGPAGCALGSLSLFLTRFDSVLFLSQFLDTVHYKKN